MTKTSSSDKRVEPRRKAHIPAFISNLDETFQMRCIIRDVSEHGCQLVASRVHEIPDEFHLTPVGFEEPLSGRVMWRDRKTMGAVLSLKDTESEFATAGSFLSSCVENMNDDDVLVLGEEPPPPMSYDRRMTIYFSELDGKSAANKTT